jgi:hypothetical protein
MQVPLAAGLAAHRSFKTSETRVWPTTCEHKLSAKYRQVHPLVKPGLQCDRKTSDVWSFLNEFKRVPQACLADSVTDMDKPKSDKIIQHQIVIDGRQYGVCLEQYFDSLVILTAWTQVIVDKGQKLNFVCGELAQDLRKAWQNIFSTRSGRASQQLRPTVLKRLVFLVGPFL